MKTAVVLIAVTAALALQTTLSGLMIGGRIPVNLVLVAVVYIALAYGAVTGMLAGTAAGLAQDALAGSIVGIGGLSKTLVGFLVGVIGAQFIVSQTIPRFVMFVAATIVHAALFMGLYVLLGLKAFPSPWAAILSQALANAAVGIIAFAVIESLPGMMERRRFRRSGR